MRNMTQLAWRSLGGTASTRLFWRGRAIYALLSEVQCALPHEDVFLDTPSIDPNNYWIGEADAGRLCALN